MDTAAAAASASPFPRPMANPLVPSGPLASTNLAGAANLVPAGRSPSESVLPALRLVELPPGVRLVLMNLGRSGLGASLVRMTLRAAGSLDDAPGAGRETEYVTSSPSASVTLPSTSEPWKNTRMTPRLAASLRDLFSVPSDGPLSWTSLILPSPPVPTSERVE